MSTVVRRMPDGTTLTFFWDGSKWTTTATPADVTPKLPDTSAPPPTLGTSAGDTPIGDLPPDVPIPSEPEMPTLPPIPALPTLPTLPEAPTLPTLSDPADMPSMHAHEVVAARDRQRQSITSRAGRQSTMLTTTRRPVRQQPLAARGAYRRTQG